MKTYFTLTKIIIFNIMLIVLTLLSAVAYINYHLGWILAICITLLTTSYHFAMRLAVGEAVTAFYKSRRHRLDSICSKTWAFESVIYKKLNVKKWKSSVITARPEQFDLRMLEPSEVIRNMTQAELVHRIIMPFSFMPLFLIIPCGAAPAFIITSVLACAIDLQCVIIQRFNRPRVIKLKERQTLRNTQQ